MKRRRFLQAAAALPLAAALRSPSHAAERIFADGFDLPLLAIGELRWRGAFRVPEGNAGGIPGDSFAYCGDPVIAIGSGPGKLLMVGQDLGGTKEIRTAAELAIPPLVASEDLAATAIASFSQPFADLLEGVPLIPAGWDSDRVASGLFHDPASGRVVVNFTRYYDAGDPPNPYTTIVLPRGDALATSVGKRGFFQMTGGARSSGWISPVPEALRGAIGAGHLFGNSDGFAILSRASIGPSAFAFDLATITGATPPADGAEIEAEALIDFPYSNPLTPVDALWEPGQVWTALSSAKFGFIVPGTGTYLALGSSGGHAAGVGYGVPPWDPDGYSGTYPNDPQDVGNHYWAFRVADMLAVRAGLLAPHELRPYAHGDWELPFQGTRHANHLHRVGGACLDPAAGLLYVSLAFADATREARLPLVLAFDFA